MVTKREETLQTVVLLLVDALRLAAEQVVVTDDANKYLEIANEASKHVTCTGCGGAFHGAEPQLVDGEDWCPGQC